jgi:hypothetical protein
MTGDLVLDAQDTTNSGSQLMRTMSPAPDKLEEARRNIFCTADWVMPGHGPMFAVTQEHKRAYNCGGQQTFQPFGLNQNQIQLQSVQSVQSTIPIQSIPPLPQFQNFNG